MKKVFYLQLIALSAALFGCNILPTEEVTPTNNSDFAHVFEITLPLDFPVSNKRHFACGYHPETGELLGYKELLPGETQILPLPEGYTLDYFDYVYVVVTTDSEWSTPAWEVYEYRNTPRAAWSVGYTPSAYALEEEASRKLVFDPLDFPNRNVSPDFRAYLPGYSTGIQLFEPLAPEPALHQRVDPLQDATEKLFFLTFQNDSTFYQWNDIPATNFDTHTLPLQWDEFSAVPWVAVDLPVPFEVHHRGYLDNTASQSDYYYGFGRLYEGASKITNLGNAFPFYESRFVCALEPATVFQYFFGSQQVFPSEVPDFPDYTLTESAQESFMATTSAVTVDYARYVHRQSEEGEGGHRTKWLWVVTTPPDQIVGREIGLPVEILALDPDLNLTPSYRGTYLFESPHLASYDEYIALAFGQRSLSLTEQLNYQITYYPESTDPGRPLSADESQPTPDFRPYGSPGLHSW